MLCMGGGGSDFHFLCVCVCLCVRLQSISKILQRLTSFLVEDFPLIQGGKDFYFEKKSPRSKVWVEVGIEIWS